MRLPNGGRGGPRQAMKDERGDTSRTAAVERTEAEGVAGSAEGQRTPSRREMRWIRTTHQERSRQTLERILAAAETLLLERDFEQISVSEIAQAAGSSVGAFYARFRDKEALLHLIHERFCEEGIATADDALDPARWEGASASEILDALAAFMTEVHRERARLLRTFVLHACTTRPEFLQRVRRLNEHLFARLHALMRERMDGFGHPDPEFALSFGMRMVAATLTSRYVLELPADAGEKTLPPAVVAEELSRAYHGYLGVPYPGQAHSREAADGRSAASGA